MNTDDNRFDADGHNKAQVDLEIKLKQLMENCCKEWEMTTPEVVGVIYCVCHEFLNRVDDIKQADDDDNFGSDEEAFEV